MRSAGIQLLNDFQGAQACIKVKCLGSSKIWKQREVINIFMFRQNKNPPDTHLCSVWDLLVHSYWLPVAQGGQGRCWWCRGSDGSRTCCWSHSCSCSDLMLLAQLPRMDRTVTRRKPAIWTTVCLTKISQRQGRPDSALIWATYLQNWCVELHDSCSGFWSQTKVLGAAIVFCTLHNTSSIYASPLINLQSRY